MMGMSAYRATRGKASEDGRRLNHDPYIGIERTIVTIAILALAGLLLVVAPANETFHVIAATIVGGVLGWWLPATRFNSGGR